MALFGWVIPKVVTVAFGSGRLRELFITIKQYLLTEQEVCMGESVVCTDLTAFGLYL